MKYMGSKRVMLENGLGEILREEAAGAKRFVDLFSGSAAVAWFAACECAREVLAVDLQAYAAVLARAVIERTDVATADEVMERWLDGARDDLEAAAESVRDAPSVTFAEDVVAVRAWARQANSGAVRAYGGYYFSPYQAAALAALRRRLPVDRADRMLCQAAVVIAGLRCSAAPGHTAQPFAATASALPYIAKAWARDPVREAREALADLAPKHASKKGRARVGNAANEAALVGQSDFVFVDPPYSRMQYSRFYHVLEALARDSVGEVSGKGRYPAIGSRPQSDYSRVSDARDAAAGLVETLAARGCRVVITYPLSMCSNGLSGEFWLAQARACFPRVDREVVQSRFSTLGGNGVLREARTNREELILVLSH